MGREARVLRHPKVRHPRFAHTLTHLPLLRIAHEITHTERIVSNFQQIELTDEEYEKLSDLGRKTPKRFNVKTTYPPFWDINIFGDELEKTTTNSIKIA